MAIYQHPIKAVLFDCDGTLLNTVPIYWQANESIIGSHYPPSFDHKVNGLTDEDEAAIVIEHFKLNMTVQEFIEKRMKYFRENMPNATIVPGMENIVKKIYNMGIPIGVATSSPREAYNIKTSKHKEFFSMFKTSVCGDDVVNGKPSPEIFLKAAKQICDFKPENILVFEDATNGIKAASAGGFPSVLTKASEREVIDEKLKELDKDGIRPTLLVDTFEDFDFSKFIWDTNKV